MKIAGHFFRWFIAGLFLALPLSIRAEQLELEVITLKYRTAQDVLPVLQPFVNQAGGTVTGMQYQLVVRTTPANLAEVKRMLASIDTLPRRLRVTVKQDNSRLAARQSAELSGNATLGKAQVIIPQTHRSNRGLIVESRQSGNSARIQSQGQELRGGENILQQLEVLEGNEAFIQVGQSVPVTEETIVQIPQGAQVVQGTQFLNTATGFYVKPRVSGEWVTLEVSPQHERLERDGQVKTERVSSVVSGRLGEWMELGGIARSGMQQNSEIASRDSERDSARNKIYIKIEEIR